MIKENTIRTHIGKRIKTARKNNHLTQSELAEAIGVSDKYIYQIESASENVSLTTLIKAANVLGEDLNYFVSTETSTVEDKLKMLPKAYQRVVENLIDNLLEALG